MSEVDSPLGVYVRLLEQGRRPYVDIVDAVVSQVEGQASRSLSRQPICTINLRRLQKTLEAEKGVKVSPHSLGRILRALFMRSGLREGEQFSVSKSGRLAARFHLTVTPETMKVLKGAAVG